MRWVVRLFTMVITNEFLSNDNGTLKNDTHTLKFELNTYLRDMVLYVSFDIYVTTQTQFVTSHKTTPDSEFYDEFYRTYCNCCKKLNLQPMPQEIEHYYDELNDFFD